MGMNYCKGCGKEIHETALACPQCGAPQDANNSRTISNDARLMLLVESKKKSGWIAALLNLFLPGVGYMYCGLVILGIFAMLFTIVVGAMTLGYGLVVITPMLFIDGFLAANRHNKKMLKELIKNTP
jgi:hypothetical protein